MLYHRRRHKENEMKVEFIGFQGNRQSHQDWALEIITETEFEKTFLSALFESDRFIPNKKLKQMQPVAALLYKEETGLTIMVSAENFGESPLAKARMRIEELEQIIKGERR